MRWERLTFTLDRSHYLVVKLFLFEGIIGTHRITFISTGCFFVSSKGSA